MTNLKRYLAVRRQPSMFEACQPRRCTRFVEACLADMACSGGVR